MLYPQPTNTDRRWKAMSNLDCLALVLAGGRGKRLGVLTKEVSKPAIPFGGTHRLIDFTLSNCKHSNISIVGILTQYRQREIAEYIGSGWEWHTSCDKARVTTLPPKKSKNTNEGYLGTADAIQKNSDFIEDNNTENVLVLSGDHVYKMDYAKMLEAHQNSGAAVTIAAVDVPWNEASRFGIMKTDENDRIVSFEEKPQRPRSNLASMGVYIFNSDILRTHLYVNNSNPDSSMDIGMDIIPQMLYFGEKVNAYKFDGYWRDVGSIYSLWEANMDLLSDTPSMRLHDEEWRIISRSNGLPRYYDSVSSPHGHIRNSIVAEGIVNKGKIIDSVISAGAEIGDDANVYNSVIMPGAKIGRGASVIRSIVGSNAVINDYTAISKVDPDGIHLDNSQGINAIGNNINISNCKEKKYSFFIFPRTMSETVPLT